ncbi:MAG: DUF1800 family protein [Gammaproteobacteria bacterium]
MVVTRALRTKVMAGLLASLMVACGGGGSGSPSTPPQAVTPPAPVGKAEAFRFLNQSTFGATEAEATRLMGLGDSSNAYSRWIDAEIAKPTQLLRPALVAAYPNPVPTGFAPATLNAVRQEQWFANVLRGEDQLRQWVAFALSQIMVVSQVGALNNLPFATADFHDMLARNAFGNFRTLLEEVTLHPAMGIYLSMLGNRRAATGTNLRPDENYAREMMQLFSIGLVQLNIDGSVRADAAGQPIPTYDQAVIEGFARVFTGWNWTCPSTNLSCTFTNTRAEFVYSPNFNQVKPMQLYADQHETGTKQLLNYTGAALPSGLVPANQTGAKDLADALDNVFNHPNVGPFIAKQLIQRLVTSNPSRAYVQRVAERFNNDGAGRRGNLEAVVRAILLDAEARNAASGSGAAVAGKLKEPLLRLTQFWRAYGVTSASGKLGVARNFSGGTPSAQFGQGQGLSPSVFNFFSPSYAPPGEIADGGFVAPEMQLATEILAASSTNYFYTQAFSRTQAQAANLNADDMYITTTDELAIAGDSEALINRVAERLLGGAGQMSAALKTEAKAQIERTTVPATNQTTALATRTADAIYFVVTSPEYALQR